MQQIPTLYRAGYERARAVDPVVAERYVRHTVQGDPEADAVTAALTAFPGAVGERWIQGGIENGPEAIPDAPQVVRDFFAAIDQAPSWFDPAQTALGCRAFHQNSQMFIGAFVGAVLVEGFSTLISKSFCITGRLVDQGVRRLKQNNRHILEIFLPRGLARESDGWKLSVRIRLVHSRVRQLLTRSPEWEADNWGTPLSAAHIGFAASAFSALLLKRARMLGVELSPNERESFMLIWRYSAYLMGVAPELLFNNEAEALQLHKIGGMCEPPPDLESIMLANGLVSSAPIVAGIVQAEQRRKLARRIYGISRAMIGNELADALRFPPGGAFGALSLLRLENRIDALLQKCFPVYAQRRRGGQFQRMLELSYFPEGGTRYRMPGQLHAENDKPL